ncbi:MAG: hypothetical protein EWM45_03945 [Rhodopseudomonas palustris]|nr:MAG: hypothetical protein EWM45_03945 [Rhodopseudomonas palustris]
MRFRAAKLLPVMIAATFAAPALSVITPVPAQAETCLTAPTGATPAGKHWRYRVERGSKRQCWYLGDKRGGSTAPVAQNSASDGEHKPAPSLADARAELIAEPSDPAPDAVWPAPEQADHSTAAATPAPTTDSEPAAAANPHWSLASRWSDATSPQDHPAPVAVEPVPAPSSTPAAASLPPENGNPEYDRNWMLMAGIVTALGLAAAIIKLAIRFGRSWPKVRAETRPGSPFDAIDIADLSAMPWTEPRTEARAKPQAAPAVKPAPQPRPSALNPEAPRQQPNWLRVAQERAQSERASQAAEQLLAQLAARRIA